MLPETVRALRYYTGKFEMLVGVISLGLASIIFTVYTRKRNAQVHPTITR